MRLPRLLRFLIALPAAAMLAACAQTPAPTAQVPAPEAITLSYAIPDDKASRAAAEALRNGFITTNSGITLDIRALPAANYANALSEAINSGTPPDLFAHTAQQVPALRQSAALLDLAPLGVAPGELSPATLEPWRAGDKLFGLPQQAVPTVLFYNRALFDAANLAYPSSEGWDWKTWRETARALSDPAQGRYGAALGGWLGLVWGNGGELFNADLTKTMLDQPEAVAGVQFGADMVNLDRSAPLPQAAGGPDPVELFRAGNLAMLPAPSTLIAELQRQAPPFPWDIAPMPVGAKKVTLLQVSGLAAYAKTTHPDAAARFIAWATGQDGLTISRNAFPFAAPLHPAVKPSSQLDVSPGFSGGKTVVDALGYGRVQPFVTQWTPINDAVNQALVPVWQGEETAAAAYQRVAPTINQLLAAG